MNWIDRKAAIEIQNKVSTRPVVLVTGIRQAGKSELLKRLFPKAEYVSFDYFHNVEYATETPSGFLDSFNGKQVILDEIQYVPELFRELKIFVDKDKQIPAKWILTGSQKFSLLESATESLAGRIGIVELKTLSIDEILKSFSREEAGALIWKGGFPETWSFMELDFKSYLDDYIATYLQKDLRSVLQVSSLRDFHRFLRACAVRTGSLVNYSDLARDTGISPNTAAKWINSLERTGLIYLLEPWFRNISKRLAKTPKLYFSDQGLLCRLLNIENREQLEKSHYLGAVWENLIFNELIRNEHVSVDRNLFFYRDQNNVEIDFFIETGGRIILIEAKYSERPDKTNIKKVSRILPGEPVDSFIFCRTPAEGIISSDGSKLINPLKAPINRVIHST